MGKVIKLSSSKAVYFSINVNNEDWLGTINTNGYVTLEGLNATCEYKSIQEFTTSSLYQDYVANTGAGLESILCSDKLSGDYTETLSKYIVEIEESEEVETTDRCTNQDNDCLDSDDGDYYCTEMTTTHIDKDTYTTEVPPLNLSEQTMKKQAKYAAEVIENALEKVSITKKCKSNNINEGIHTKTVKSVTYTESDFYKIVQGVNASELSNVLKIKGALLLVSPPGTGKTTTAIELAKYIKGETNSDNVVQVSFNQNTSYSDFIGGYKKNDDGEWELQKGTFFKLCDKAYKDPDNIYIQIVDEINRANTEAVFGEALSGLSKRGESFKTNIGLDLVVPENVYVIATMNSTDYSITSLDTALVDRFAIYNMPEIELDIAKLNTEQRSVNGVDLVKKAIQDINDILSLDIYKGKDNQIGNRALFTNYTSKEELLLVVKYDIQPKVKAKLSTLTKNSQDEVNSTLDKLIKHLEEM